MTSSSALIIGGSSGIGLATARRLAASGTIVHIAGRSHARLDDLKQSDPHLIGHALDAADPGAVSTVAEAIGPLDHLILTLSGSEGMGAIADLDLAMLRSAFEAKFWGHLTSIQAALPFIAPDGSITLLSAITARSGMAGTSGLAAINAAVEALVKPLAVELAPIRVNAVSPGLVDTPWWDGLPADARDAYFTQAAASLPTGRIATADDIAQVVVLAATNRNLTGTVIETDGGARLVTVG